MFKKDYVKLLLLIIPSCLVLLWVFQNYIATEQKNKNEKIIDAHITELLSMVNTNKNLALTVSLLLSKDQSIHECVNAKKIDICDKYLKESRDTLIQNEVFHDLKLHIHTKELKSFYRAWTKGEEHDALDSFRHTIKKVKETKKCLSAIEIGRSSMLMRGISPILQNGEYLGSIEAILDFQDIINYFKRKGSRLYILMDKEYLDIVTHVKFRANQLLENYVVLNQEVEDYSFLNEVTFKNTSYTTIENYHLVYTPIFDFQNKIIGYYVLKLYL